MFDIFKKTERIPTATTVKGDLTSSKFVTLIILDGFGVHEDAEGNAVLASKTPFLDTAWTYGRSTLVHASGTHAGLPEDEPGNSEVGHLNLGAGQVVYQTLPRINDAIKAHELENNLVIKEMFEKIRKEGTKLHLVGILTPAGVHGHISHLFSLLELCRAEGVSPYIHVMLDGRDAPQKDGYLYVRKLQRKMAELGVGQIASMMGRFYGMDRDTRWERTKLAYDAMVGLSTENFTDPIQALEKAYAQGEDDQFFIPRTALKEDGLPVGTVKSGDAVLFWNFREDRARQLTKAFVLPEFPHFSRRSYPYNLFFATMTGYEEGLSSHVVFPPHPVKKSFAAFLAEKGKRQIHMSETEKHMHVTYFFNGGIEKPHEGELFFNIPSPRVENYAEVPAMSAEILRDEAVKRIKKIKTKPFEFMLINFANPDMLGHTGDIRATVRGIEIVDGFVADISKEVLAAGGAMVITADHGNCETMINRKTKAVDLAHTNNPVPLTILTKQNEIVVKNGTPVQKIGTGANAKATGLLADVAPTCLGVIGSDIPTSMTGVDLRYVI